MGIAREGAGGYRATSRPLAPSASVPIVSRMDTTDDAGSPTEMTAEEKRRDQLLAAPGAVEADAAPRIRVSEHDGVTRIDIDPDAPVRPGNPEEEPPGS